jgi:hypothetical protein
LDVAKQLALVSYEIDELGENSNSAQVRETQVNRYFLVQEMAAFLENSDLQSLQFSPAYADGLIDESTWHILAVARRN